MKGLIEYFEKTLDRKLTTEEKLIVKKAYKFGKANAFDIPKKTNL